MNWKFILIDRDGNQTVIEEPVGWDNFSIRLKRHPQRHGTMRELQGNNFQFIGRGGDLLKLEYEQYGIRGQYNLIIKFKCGGTYDEFYTGTINFDSYSYTCGPTCYVTADIEQTGPLAKFINRIDQKVDLTNPLAFDGATLADYGMPKTITLPSKAIVLQAASRTLNTITYKVSDDSGWIFVDDTGELQGSLNAPWDTTDINTIKDYKPVSTIDFYNFTQNNEYVPELIYNNPTQNLNCIGKEFDIDLKVAGYWSHDSDDASGNIALAFIVRKGPNQFVAGVGNVDIFTQFILGDIGGGVALSTLDTTTLFDISYTGTVTIEPGEKLWVDFYLTFFKATNFIADESLVIFGELLHFTAQTISKCDPTQANVSLINETTSRVIESITNNDLKLYSEWLGRTDSQPFSFAGNGCGALRALCTGLDIRGQKLTDGTAPKMFLSMQDIFDALSAIDNIGVGQEDDDKIRLEYWKFFYQPDIIHSCFRVDTIEKSVSADRCYSIFKTGYEKWEAENVNGLDEFLTKREYRTSLTQVQNTLEKTCKWIASGYAWEVTRRIQATDQDWRYDNDIFIVCLQNVHRGTITFSADLDSILVTPSPFYIVGHTITITGTVSNDGTYTITSVAFFLTFMIIGLAEPVTDESADNVVLQDTTAITYEVELGNIEDAENIIDPDTVYNYRISPERMAMNWFPTIVEAYRGLTNDDQVIFTSGEGNYVAKGQLKFAECKKEADAIAENDNISVTTFADADDALPIIWTESLKYKFPLGANDYKKIIASPYGLIEYSSGCERGEGWIDELEYFPEQGIAKFTLLPKIKDNELNIGP